MNAQPFRHTPRELAVLARAHAAMMTNIRAGLHYDVATLCWVPAAEFYAKYPWLAPNTHAETER